MLGEPGERIVIDGVGGELQDAVTVASTETV
jgi:hypothetical protein